MLGYNSKDQNYISEEHFQQLNRNNIIYVGFVEGVGYAFEEKIHINESFRSKHGIFEDKLYSIQRIDRSPEAFVRSLHLTEEQIKKMISFPNSDGSFSVNMGPGTFRNRILKLNSLDDLIVDINYNCIPATLTVEAREWRNNDIITDQYTIPLRDFDVYYEKELASYLLKTLDIANSIVGTSIGWLNDKWITHSSENTKFKHKLSYEISKTLQYHKYDVKPSLVYKNMGKILQRANKFSIGVTGLSLIIGGFKDRNVKVSDIYTVTTAAMTFIPCVGTVLGTVFLRQI